MIINEITNNNLRGDCGREKDGQLGKLENGNTKLLGI
jgi:hypothetical protein